MASTKKHSELCQHGDGAGKRRSYCHEERVAILDVGKFMGNDARNLVAREHVEQPARSYDRCILRITPGGECVRLWIVHNIDARHWQPRAIGQFSDDVNELSRRTLVDFLGAVHRQYEPVGIPVGDEIHCGSDEERYQSTIRSPDQIADHHKQASQPSEQNCGPQVAHRNPQWIRTRAGSAIWEVAKGIQASEPPNNCTGFAASMQAQSTPQMSA